MSLLLALLFIVIVQLIVNFYLEKHRDKGSKEDSELNQLTSLAGRLGNRYANLISAIIGHLSLLDECATNEQRKNIKAIEEAVTSATALNQALTVFSRTESKSDVCDVKHHLKTIAPVLSNFKLIAASKVS